MAMSGGVDSSVAAALACEKYGKENVFGVTAKFFCYSGEAREKACCSLDSINDAKAVCESLGIPHYVIDEQKEFEKTVIRNFVEAYRHGQTPIPCIPCNSIIKFGTMLKHVQKLGAEKLITGHYARVEPSQVKSKKLNVKSVRHSEFNSESLDSGSGSGMTYALLRGVDERKDQTYFLHGLNQEQLSRTEFPIGDMTKPEVRKIAKKLGLKTAEKKESQGVCFINEGTVVDWLADKIERHPGNIVDTAGNIVGQHDGIVFYTVGQRKRIGGGHEKPMFVVGIRPIENEVVIGTQEELNRKELIVHKIHWINEPKLPLKCTAKIRYNMHDTECIVKMQNLNIKNQNYNSKLKNSGLSENFRSARAHDEGKFQISNYSVVFSKPQRAITPGQSVVFYDGDVCLGGGVIAG